MKPASAKSKGRILQQLVRDKILALHPTLEADDVKSTSMGAGGEDVQLSPAARKLFPYSVECKSRAAFPAYAWLDQAKHNAPKGTEPIVVIKKNYSKPIVLMDLDYFFSLMERLK